MKAIWARVEAAVLAAASSGIHPGHTEETANVPNEPLAVSTAAIVPSVVAGETFAVIQDGQARELAPDSPELQQVEARLHEVLERPDKALRALMV